MPDFHDSWQVFSVSIDYLMYADSCCFCYTYDNRCLISASKRRPRSGFPPVLTNCKSGFQLVLRKDMGHEIVKKPLHTGS
jgi:hypothetical protein